MSTRLAEAVVERKEKLVPTGDLSYYVIHALPQHIRSELSELSEPLQNALTGNGAHLDWSRSGDLVVNFLALQQQVLDAVQKAHTEGLDLYTTKTSELGLFEFDFEGAKHPVPLSVVASNIANVEQVDDLSIVNASPAARAMGFRLDSIHSPRLQPLPGNGTRSARLEMMGWSNVRMRAAMLAAMWTTHYGSTHTDKTARWLVDGASMAIGWDALRDSFAEAKVAGSAVNKVYRHLMQVAVPGILAADKPVNPKSSAGLTAFVKATRTSRAELSNSWDKRQSRLPMSLDELLPAGAKSSRIWGIEIEVVTDSVISKKPRGWEKKSDGSLRERWNPALHPSNKVAATETAAVCNCGWETNNEDDHYDACAIWGSEVAAGVDLSTYEYTHPETGETQPRTNWGLAEYISPPLSSFRSAGLKQLCTALGGVNDGLAPNFSPGIHVHVDASEMDVAGASRLVFLYSMVESILMQHSWRDSTEYCLPVNEDALNIASTRLDDDSKEVFAAFSSRRRYQTLNMNSLEKHGTVEFRGMGAYYRYDHLLAWAWIHRELVNVAVDNTVLPHEWKQVNDIEALIALLKARGREYNNGKSVPSEKIIGSFDDEN